MVFCSVASSNEYIRYATWNRHILPASCAIRSKWEESVEASTYDKPLCTLLVNVKQSTFCCSDCKHTQHDRNRKQQQAETRHYQTQMYNNIALSLGVSTRQNWHCEVLPLQLIIVQEHALQPRDLLHGSQHDFARCRQAATLTGHYNRANRGAVSNANINSLSILLDQLQRISVHIKHKCTGVWVWWQHLQNKVQSTRRRPSLGAMTQRMHETFRYDSSV